MRRMLHFFGRTIRAVGIIARDGRIPEPLRAAAALALLPIPGPFDEAVLLLSAHPMFIFYRHSMRDAWKQSLTHPDQVRLTRARDP